MLKRPLSKSEYGPFIINSYSTVDSTNDMLMQAAREGAKSGTVVFAHGQTAGKGSKGRSFYSPFRSGMYLSILIRPGYTVNANVHASGEAICPELTPEQALLITPAVACAVAFAIQEYSYDRVGIKWVNDIMITGKKVCGILTESGVDDSGDRFYVIGIGINLAPPKDGFPEEFADKTTTLFDKEPGTEMITLLDDILGFTCYILKNTLTDRKFLEYYRKMSVILGRDVLVTPLDGSEPYYAKAVEIDDNARLVVENEAGERITLNSEDVQIAMRNYPQPARRFHVSRKQDELDDGD
ncbi:MAG: biotin--[acetyl-CoA-carboxylase] ligase [Oscillospiraceae bacterium]|nr:biotin--[acetyl-CoA-carboxylase] ligase [Oscillospiraceae bacterium]